MTKKIFICILIVILIVVGAYLWKRFVRKSNIVITSAEIMNKFNDLNNTVENKVEEDKAENKEEENKLEEKEETKTESTAQTPKEQAIEIVKENWGEDDTVSFFVNDKTTDGKYQIDVVDKDSTKVLYRYYVDVDSGTFDIE